MGKSYGGNKLKGLMNMRIDVLKARIVLIEKGFVNIVPAFLKDYPEFKELSDGRLRNMLSGALSVKDTRFRDCFCFWVDEISKQ